MMLFVIFVLYVCNYFCICLDILEQSAVWVDEVNYYDLRLNRNKGISPLSLRQADPLGIETDKYEKAVTHFCF